LPVLASRNGAIPEVIEHGVDGFIFDPSDHAGFVRVIVEMAEHRELMERIGREGRKKFLENYTSLHLENNMRDLYDNCLSDIR
jgi:glycosyltransferase involved in cell wall biosynthesis